jgi:hypothetical protein
LTDTNGNPGEKKDARGTKRAWPLFVGLPLIILIAVTAVVFSGGEEGTPRSESGKPSAEEDPAGQPSQAGDEQQASGGEKELGHPALGETGAPVVMIEYGDYQ